jgi:hypothetical protein
MASRELRRFSISVTSSGDGERHEPHVIIHVEALYRLHQAHIAFLDQVIERQSVAEVALGYVHDEAQVREHQLPGGVEIVVLAKANGQRALLFLGQDRHGADRLDVGIKAADRATQDQVIFHRRKRSSHRFFNLPKPGPILALDIGEC